MRTTIQSQATYEGVSGIRTRRGARCTLTSLSCATPIVRSISCAAGARPRRDERAAVPLLGVRAVDRGRDARRVEVETGGRAPAAAGCRARCSAWSSGGGHGERAGRALARWCSRLLWCVSGRLHRAGPAGGAFHAARRSLVDRGILRRRASCIRCWFSWRRCGWWQC